MKNLTFSKELKKKGTASQLFYWLSIISLPETPSLYMQNKNVNFQILIQTTGKQISAF